MVKIERVFLPVCSLSRSFQLSVQVWFDHKGKMQKINLGGCSVGYQFRQGCIHVELCDAHVGTRFKTNAGHL